MVKVIKPNVINETLLAQIKEEISLNETLLVQKELKAAFTEPF